MTPFYYTRSMAYVNGHTFMTAKAFVTYKRRRMITIVL